jgi:hypothetical protein
MAARSPHRADRPSTTTGRVTSDGAIIAVVSDEDFDPWYERHTRDDGDRRSPRDETALRNWFRDLYDERGPVASSEIEAAFIERQVTIVRQAIEAVLKDLTETTGLRPSATVEVESGLAVAYWGDNSTLKSCCSLSGFAVNELDLFVIAADDMRDNIVDDLNKAWPSCPRHSFGLHPQVRGETPIWWCHYGDGHAVSEIGLLTAGLNTD